jgi:hypothetical protein
MEEYLDRKALFLANSQHITT